MTRRTIRVGGFFSGIGSHISACKRLTDRADFEFVFQCEWDMKTAQASDDMHGPIPNLGDITQVHDIGGDLWVDILYWTPPCQDISNAGQMKGNAKGSGTRSALAYEVPRILAATDPGDRPKYLVMEEVPMMISAKFKPNFDALLGELSALGYQHTYGILSATDCGVAQSRKRCFVISKLGGPAPRLPAPIPLTKCLRDYLEPEPVAPEYYLSEDRLKGLIWSNQKEQEAGRGFRFEPTDGGGGRSLGHHPWGRTQDGQLSDKGRIMQYGRVKYGGRGTVHGTGGSAPTITAHIAKNRDEGLVGR